MTDDLRGRVTELEKRVAAADARAEERAAREKRIESKVDILIDDMNTRIGREAARANAAERGLKDRHEIHDWLRSFIPTGIWVAFWAAIVWASQKLGIDMTR